MKKIIISFTAVCVASTAFGQDRIAAWDFSQLAAGFGGFGIDNGVSAAGEISANYSDFDPTSGVGLESAAFGTAFFDGTFGSSDVTPAGAFGFGPWQVDGNGVSANESGFGLEVISEFEGAQLGAGPQGIFANDPFTVTAFEFDLSSINSTADNLAVEFAFQDLNSVDAGSIIEVFFSEDGSSFSSFGSVTTTGAAQAATLSLDPSISASTGVFQFQVTNTSGFASIDNVEILGDVSVVPEPSTYAAIFGGLALGLAILRRRLRRS